MRIFKCSIRHRCNIRLQLRGRWWNRNRNRFLHSHIHEHCVHNVNIHRMDQARTCVEQELKKAQACTNRLESETYAVGVAVTLGWLHRLCNVCCRVTVILGQHWRWTYVISKPTYLQTTHIILKKLMACIRQRDSTEVAANTAANCNFACVHHCSRNSEPMM